MIKKHIPNAITCGNLFSGCAGLAFALRDHYEMAFICIAVSGILDFFDGFTARLLNVHSKTGKELDSLADVVSFGVAPAMVMHRLLLTSGAGRELSMAGFAIAVFSALRLANFNLDESQKEDFKGLNTPTNAFVLATLPLAFNNMATWLLLAITAVSCWLLVSNIWLFSLKPVKGGGLPAMKWKLAFLICSIIAIAFFKFAAAPVILVLYIIFSTIHFNTVK